MRSSLQPSPVFRHRLQRSVALLLCTLMLLIGSPTQLLADTITVTPRQEAWDAVDEAWQGTRRVVQQPWFAAVGVLLATAVPGLGDGDDEERPPNPPGFSPEAHPYRDAALEALSAVNKSALDAIPMIPGWNLVSLPEEPASTDPATVMASLGGAYSSVWTYDACDVNPWKFYDPNDLAGSTLTQIDHHDGLWVEATAPVDLLSDGTLPATTTFQLCTGWNLIGFPAGQARHVRNALQSIEGKYVRVFGHDPADSVDPWEVYTVGAPAWANDLTFMQPGRGYWVLVTEAVTLEIANQDGPPDVQIHSPEEVDALTTFTPVIGTVTSKILDYWELSYRRVGEGPWVELDRGFAPATQEELSSFDPTLLRNGLYELRLEAYDIEGRGASTSIQVVLEGRQKIGHLRLEFLDLELDFAHLPLQIVRTYDSRDRHNVGDFGHGWRLSVNDVEIWENIPAGVSWTGTTSGTATTPSYGIASSLPHIVAIALPGGDLLRFRVFIDPEQTALVPPQVVTVGFVPLPGTFATLEPVGLGNELRVVGSFPGPIQLFDQDLDVPFDPERYKLTLSDGTVMILSDLSGLVEVSEPNGSTLTFSDNGIVHSNGPSVSFTRDGQGRIEEIRGTRGETLSYSYDTAGDLRSFEEELGILQYNYVDDHFLDEIIDADGVRTSAFDYDDDGRLIGVCDRINRCNIATHDLVGQREIIVDAEGVKTILEYDDRGNITAVEDGLQNRKLLFYDDLDRLDYEIDGEGNLTDFDWDGSDMVEVILPHEPGQNAADFTYSFDHDNFGNRTLATFPSGGELHWDYDTKGNLMKMHDEDNNVFVEYMRDGEGRVYSETDPISTATYENFNVFDTPERMEVDGEVWLSQYDDSNRLTFFDDGRLTTSFDFSEPRSVLRQQTGEPDMRFGSFFDGSLSSWQVEDDTYLSFQRDGFSRLDRVTTSTTLDFDHDAAGRLSSLQYAFGEDTEFTYDDAGRRNLETTSRGQVTEFVYDGADRVIAVRDSVPSESPEVSVSSMTYWPNGEIKTLTDARQHTWSFEHTPTERTVTDPLTRQTTTHFSTHGLVTREVYADTNDVTWTYALSHPLLDAQSYVASRTDESNRTQTFGYGDDMQLTSASDLAGELFQYGYENSFLTSITSPGQRTIGQSYDDQDRIQFITRQDGEQEELLYSGFEDLESGRILPSGRQIDLTYDAQGDLVGRTSNGVSESFTYLHPGLMSSATSSEGTTLFDYDAADGGLRLVDTPGSGSLEIQRDGRGRVHMVTTRSEDEALSYTTTYTYDIAGNVETILDPLGGTTHFDYDIVNRLEFRTLPNGIVTQYEYDLRDRIRKITHRNAQQIVLASIEYTRDPSGEPRRIDREDGSYVEIDYDGALRVEEERFFDTAGVQVDTTTYAYDLDGNRQTVTRDGMVDTYGYGNGHRLTSVSGPNPQQLTMDDDGRTTIIQSGADVRTLSYDFLDRLQQVDDNGQPAVSYRHDARGQRLAVTQGGAETRLLTTPTPTGAGLSQPHLATASDHSLVAGFVFAGSAPLMRFGPEGPIYYLEDGVGSIIALADSAATPVAGFQYDAFGMERQTTGTPPSTATLGGDFRFQGQWLDETTGLYHLRARQYAPQLGRFLSRDPVPFQIDQPELSHPYVYAGNNPFLYSDPLGLFAGGINEQSVMNAIQSNLGRMRAAFVKDLLRDVRNQAIRQGVNSMAKTLAKEVNLTSLVNKNYKALGFNTRGDLFEFYGLRSICNTFTPSWTSRLWFEPWVDVQGNPKTDGFQCPPGGKSGAAGRKKEWGPVGRPDILLPVRHVRPTQMPRIIMQTVFIGDLKITLKYAYSTWRVALRGKNKGKRKQENQFQGLRHHAARYGFRLVAVFALSKGGRGDYCQSLQNLFLRGAPKVILIGVTLTGGLCPAVNIKSKRKR